MRYLLFASGLKSSSAIQLRLSCSLRGLQFVQYEVMNMRKCGICGDVVPDPDQDMEGDVCWACADRYDECGVLFCLE